LPAASLPQVRAQLQQGDIVVIAENDTGRALATGKLAMIDNQISAATATIAYKGSFDNADEALWPGQFVNIRLLLQVRHNALTVPVTAVVRGPEGAYAFVIDADRVVQKRPIEVGFANKAIAIVNNGLVVGEQIVTDGQYRIQAGSRVEIQASSAASASSPREPGPLGAIR
jgi:multidrug efflux system membrane fusion protein